MVGKAAQSGRRHVGSDDRLQVVDHGRTGRRIFGAGGQEPMEGTLLVKGSRGPMEQAVKKEQLLLIERAEVSLVDEAPF
jgi:hypothetical protein